MLSGRDWAFFAVLLVANVIQAITGFAGTVLAMPFLMLLIGADEARAVLAVMALISCAVIAVRGRRFIDRGELSRIVAFMAVGMAIGMVVYSLMPLDVLRRVYGAFIVVVALHHLLVGRRRALSRPALAGVLLAAGVIHGMFVSGGALLVVYAAQVLPDKDRFRSTMAAVWVPLNIVMLAQLGASGGIDEHAVALSVIGLVPLCAAVAIGGWLGRRLDQRAFMTLTYVLLAVSGASIML
ncbi:sulfite exporter TauE/SafE family protein [Bifidobacterium phasiani]|uniref:Probable membrane transporter protein n=1 Tax=Bifidobacterium phasiani TaxID=2834431 RepID=A0ABS6W7L7_9BIFI|nr:sulfite exporter TauE/SafE family protein [Bifidobacterium phasiani]MBW3082342.1 sulfite exporter TauE/SafE family protein [Bifidobacterium phasiani]